MPDSFDPQLVLAFGCGARFGCYQLGLEICCLRPPPGGLPS
jgi:hypothetical protein